MFNLFVSLAILVITNKLGKILYKRHWRGWIVLKTAATKAKMDALKVEIGKRFLPVFENMWRDIAVLTEFDL